MTFNVTLIRKRKVEYDEFVPLELDMSLMLLCSLHLHETWEFKIGWRLFFKFGGMQPQRMSVIISKCMHSLVFFLLNNSLISSSSFYSRIRRSSEIVQVYRLGSGANPFLKTKEELSGINWDLQFWF